MQSAWSEEKEQDYPRFTLGGQVQLQYDGGSLKSRSLTSRAPVRNGIGAFPTDDKISLRRLRVYPRVHFSPKLSLINETDLEPDEFEPESLIFTVLDLYLKYDFRKDHSLRLGQSKVPFGEEFLRSSRKITLIERSDTSRLLFQRDIGLSLFGKSGKWDYAAGVFQGQGQNESERNGGEDVVARFGYQVTPGLRLGASGQLGTYRPDRLSPDFKVRRAGFEVRYQDGPWTLNGEYITSDGYNLFSQEATDARGFLLYSTHRVRPELDLVVGYDRFDPDLGAVNSNRSDNRRNERDRLTLGLNYYFSREPVHRFMFNYEFRNELEGPSVSSSGPRIRYQYSW